MRPFYFLRNPQDNQRIRVDRLRASVSTTYIYKIHRILQGLLIIGSHTQEEAEIQYAFYVRRLPDLKDSLTEPYVDEHQVADLIRDVRYIFINTLRRPQLIETLNTRPVPFIPANPANLDQPARGNPEAPASAPVPVPSDVIANASPRDSISSVGPESASAAVPAAVAPVSSNAQEDEWKLPAITSGQGISRNQQPIPRIPLSANPQAMQPGTTTKSAAPSAAAAAPGDQGVSAAVPALSAAAPATAEGSSITAPSASVASANYTVETASLGVAGNNNKRKKSPTTSGDGEKEPSQQKKKSRD